MDDGQYRIALDHERGLVRVHAKGDFDANLGQELITDAREKAAENQYHIVCDVRESRARVALADWFFLPRRLGVYQDFKTRNIKTAIIVTPGRQENAYRFFEIVASNVGLNIRIFLHEEDALEWLGGISK
jgi:hypothetical protein